MTIFKELTKSELTARIVRWIPEINPNYVLLFFRHREAILLMKEMLFLGLTILKIYFISERGDIR